jgi:hypothetical protein
VFSLDGGFAVRLSATGASPTPLANARRRLLAEGADQYWENMHDPYP